jgi:hypothetical protein
MEKNIVVILLGMFLLSGGMPAVLAEEGDSRSTHTVLVELGSYTW